MRTYQEFITEIKRYNLRRRGGDPFTHYDDGKRKPLDLSWIHKMGDDAAKSTAKAKEQREKKNKQADTRRRMDAAGKKLGLPEEFVDPEHGEAPSGRSPLQNVSDHPKASVRKKAVKGFRKQMEKEYGGRWKSRSNDPVREEYIDETSLTRVMRKSQKGGMAIMSAQRGDKSKAENKARSKQLERDVRGAGLPGPTKVAGRYTENPGTPQEKKVGEKSHVITPGKKGKRKFKKAIEKLGKKYDQDSVLIQRKGGGEATLKGTSKTSWPGQGKNVKIGKMKPGRTGEFDTKVKNKTFTVEH
jgi:hypothetical protein